MSVLLIQKGVDKLSEAIKIVSENCEDGIINKTHVMLTFDIFFRVLVTSICKSR